MSWSNELLYRDCPWCRTKNLAMTQHANVQASTAGGSIRHWTLLCCPRCGGVVAIEYAEAHPPGVLTIVPESRSGEQVDHLPEDVKTYYEAAVTVLEAGVPDAAAVQLRRTLEAACAQFGVPGFPLNAAVQGLIDKNLITSEFGKVLGHIRKLGNLGAHASDVSVNDAEARLALRFTTQVLRNLFEIPAELAALGTPPASDTT